jgi:hypothetical protein
MLNLYAALQRYLLERSWILERFSRSPENTFWTIKIKVNYSLILQIDYLHNSDIKSSLACLKCNL